MRKESALEVALIGSGIFEPLTTAASKRVSTVDRIVAYDSALSVTRTLERLLQPTLDHEDGKLVRLSPLNRNRLLNIGIDTSLLWDRSGKFRPTKSVKRRISVYRRDLFDLAAQWSASSQQWDLIVCVNVFPNISIRHGEGVVEFILDQLWHFTRDRGLALIGTIDSHFYHSDLHPTRLGFFSQEMRRAVQKSRWDVIGLVERAFVREKRDAHMLSDGYLYLILGKNGCDFSEVLSDVGKLVPRNLPQSFYLLNSLPVETFWHMTANHHVLAAFKAGSTFHFISLRESFPNSLSTVLALTHESDLSFGICENLLSCCVKPCS